MADRLELAKLARAAHSGVLSVEAAAKALGLPARAIALRLASLARRKWIVRVRRGLYLIPPIEAEPGKPITVEDPWVLAREVFSPCYIGGWSAAEYWELTEQIFRSTLVVTAAHVRERTIMLVGHEYRLFSVPRERMSDMVLVWRGSERIPVSSREQTIVDGLQYPELCGGLRHVAHIMGEYGRIKERDFRKLAAVVEGTGSGAVWKRLGYLSELLWPGEKTIIEDARRHLSAGNVRLDPTVAHRGKLLRRWGLLVNVSVSDEDVAA